MAKEAPDGQEKTEEPSGRRKSKARSDGNVPKSQEINMVAGLFAALLYFALQGSAMMQGIKMLLVNLLSRIHEVEITLASTVKLMQDLVSTMMSILMPFMLVLFIVAILSNVFQIGFLFTLKPFQPQLSKFNTIKGLKKKVSVSNLVKLVKSVFRIAVISWVPYMILKNEIHNIPNIMDYSIWEIICYIGFLLLKIVLYVGLVLLVLAIIDLVYQRWKHNRDLKMTKQEVKDEQKQMEGDPKIKAKIRQIQFQRFRQIMLDSVKTADVVITNPIHYAVALKYDRAQMDAPTVVAKGARKLAQKIKEIAKEYNVPVVENKPLAQSLYKMADVGDTIPESLYKAVAEVLAYVYSRKNRGSAVGE